ncbi:inverted formin-2-like [Bos taurus]|uniref:inverted formin-2-like n=1 Tax=Bos taurus TaxID=9913 RepID=UPI0028CB353C|nr:inverted formin-2-like [Bos taurus]
MVAGVAAPTGAAAVTPPRAPSHRLRSHLPGPQRRLRSHLPGPPQVPPRRLRSHLPGSPPTTPAAVTPPSVPPLPNAGCGSHPPGPPTPAAVTPPGGPPNAGCGSQALRPHQDDGSRKEATVKFTKDNGPN